MMGAWRVYGYSGLSKNAGYQTHRWSGVWPGEYFLHLRTVWNTEKWVYDREASVYDC